jgi:type I restriction enzyme R subunit
MMQEADTRAFLIDPMLTRSGWDSPALVQREYIFTDGRKLIGNKRGEKLKADYLLKMNNVRLAFIEAKAEHLSPTEGLEQVKNYGLKLGLSIVYSTNGHKIYEFDLRSGRGNYIDNYPSPEQLYTRLIGEASALKTQLLSIPLQNSGKQERYYQEIAIRRTMEAVGDGKKRVLLTLATGTGKTYVAFQIAYKLYQAKWNTDGADRRPKILFLADRNILADQAINAFNYFDKDLVKITGKEIRKRNGVPPTERNFYFAIYQAIADRGETAPTEDDSEDGLQDGFYKLYDPDFFDVIIIDECHRGSASEEGNWRKILDYFGNALHIGLTATPKRQDNADTYQYFGEPVYQYSLIDGINDGFLTPYKVLRLGTNMDSYALQAGDRIVQGNVDKASYELSDFERNIILPQRTDFIARQILIHTERLDKTIIFCVTQDHAADMRDAINRHKDSTDPNYCVRITSNEGKVGKDLLEQFKDNDKTMPVMVTSSQMLTTGVDVLNVRNIVIVRQIGSMTEFKQIIGRGTRLYDGKDFFTILDFTGATELFQDPTWDGPVESADPKLNSTGEAPNYIRQEPSARPDINLPERPAVLTVELGPGRSIEINQKQYFYVTADGKTLDAEAYLREIMGHLPALYQSEAQLRAIWQDPKTRRELIKKLESEGLSGDQLIEFKRLLHAENSDIIDVLTFLQYDSALSTYTERVIRAKGDDAFFNRYRDQRAKNFLYFILDQYEQHGVQELDLENLSQLIQKSLFLGNRREAVQAFGGKPELIQQAFLDLQVVLFKQ